MGILGKAVLLSAAATIGVVGWAAAAKVRIDSRSHFASAEGLVALGSLDGDGQLLQEAGIAYQRSIQSYVPFDATPRRACRRLGDLAEQLSSAGEPSVASDLLHETIDSLDRRAWLFMPLDDERAQLEKLAVRLESTSQPTEVTPDER
jgi:hypothetical protein